jgi:hypothetical protein
VGGPRFENRADNRRFHLRVNFRPRRAGGAGKKGRPGGSREKRGYFSKKMRGKKSSWEKFGGRHRVDTWRSVLEDRVLIHLPYLGILDEFRIRTH